MSVFADVFAPSDPNLVDLSKVFQFPSAAHLLGTDSMGRDVLSRILYGGRISLAVSLLSVAISTCLGIIMGGISGYLGGWVDNLLMRVIDALLSIPQLIIMLSLQAIIQGGAISIILIIGLTSWMATARVIRTSFVVLKEKEYVKSAILMGASPGRVVIHHLLRGSLPELLIIGVFNCSSAIFAEVSLSFLGIGIPPEIPSWGNMLTGAQSDVMTGAWWIALFPGLMIVVSLLAVNFIGENIKRKFNY